MDDKEWLAEYFERYRKVLFGVDVRAQLVQLRDLIKTAQSHGKKVIMAGNGGSAAIASHCAVDFTKSATIRCINFNEADLITCLANDFGYDQVFARQLKYYARKEDFVVIISSSGKSPNIVNAAQYACAEGMTLVTFTGFSENNPLRKLGRLNLWVDSRAYNVIEMTHQIWLLAVCDLIIGKAEYPLSQS